MNFKIETIENLYIEATQIQVFLDMTMSEDANEAHYRGNDLATYLARTSKMMADAKHHYNTRLESDMVKKIREAMEEVPVLTSTAINSMVKALCRDEQYLVNWTERLNNTCGRQLDWCRTVISKAKEEMRLAGNQRT